MLPNRIRISKESSDQLKYLKSRTGVTPNVLSRIALVLSLKNRRLLMDRKTELDGLEFNATTLFGNYTRIFEALLVQLYGPLNVREFETAIANHVSDGLVVLKKVRNLTDILHCK